MQVIASMPISIYRLVFSSMRLKQHAYSLNFLILYHSNLYPLEKVFAEKSI